jgi:hypothetical protein
MPIQPNYTFLAYPDLQMGSAGLLPCDIKQQGYYSR